MPATLADTDRCVQCSTRLRGGAWCSLCGQARDAQPAPRSPRLGETRSVPVHRVPPARTVGRALQVRLALSVAVLAWPVWHLLVNLASIEGCIYCQIREFVLFCGVGIALCVIWGVGVASRIPAAAQPLWVLVDRPPGR